MPVNIAVYPEKLTKCCNAISCLQDSFNLIPINSLNEAIFKKFHIDVLIMSACNLENCPCNHPCLIIFPVKQTEEKIDVKKNLVKVIKCPVIYKINLGDIILDIVKKSSPLAILGIDPESLSSRLIKIVNILEKDPFKSAENIAFENRLSRVHFSNIVKKELGISFTRFRLWFRVALVIKLIKENDNNLKTIAFELKYSTPSHIYRDFKRTIGVTPGDFTKNFGHYDLKTLFEKQLV